MESWNPLFQTQNVFQTAGQFESEGSAMNIPNAMWYFDAYFKNKS